LVLASGEYTTYSTLLNFKPELIVLDADDNLAEAITTDQKILRDTAMYDFAHAMMAVQVKSIKDPALIRVEHNWLPADGMIKPINNLHLDNVRYWTVDGIFNSSLKAAGIFEYSGFLSDHLDGSFIANEDSLVMMYRPDQQTDWKPANSFYVDKGGNDSDKVGAIVVYPLKKGEYTIGIYNSQLPNETGSSIHFESISKATKEGIDFKVHFEGSKNAWIIDFEKNIFGRVEINDANGKKLWERKLEEMENHISLDRGTATGNSYCLTLTTKTGKRISKKLINE